jgi:hypothetical protein
MHMQDVRSVNEFCNSRPMTLRLQQRFHSQTNHVSTGLELTNTDNEHVWSVENFRAIRSRHDQRQFSTNLCAS